MEFVVARGIMSTRRHSGASDEAEQQRARYALASAAVASADFRPASGAAAESLPASGAATEPRPTSSDSMWQRDSAQSEPGEPWLFASLARSISPPPDAEPSLFGSLKGLVEPPSPDAKRESVRFRITTF
jgi:hypothetical protein